VIATTILEDKTFVAEFTKKSRGLLSKHYTIATKILDKAGIDYVRDGWDLLHALVKQMNTVSTDPDNSNAGFFLWIDLSPYLTTKTDEAKGWEAEAALKKSILEAGVEMSSGAGYHEEKPGWFRVLFTVEKDALEEALKRSRVPSAAPKFK